MRQKGKKRFGPFHLGNFAIFTDFFTGLTFFTQQNQVIAELSEYVEGNPPDKLNVCKTIEYLDGCRDLFERGILSHEKIVEEHSPVLQNMLNGFSFFVGWADYAWEQGEDFSKIII